MNVRCRLLVACGLGLIMCLGAGANPANADLMVYFAMDESESPLVDGVAGLTAEAVDDGHQYEMPGPDGFGNAVGLTENGSWQLDVDESEPLRELLNDFSVAAWVYLDSDVLLDKFGPNFALNRIIGDDVAWDADGWSFGVWEDGRVRFTKNGVVDLDTLDAWVAPDEWVHVAATVSSVDGVTIYAGGEEAQLFGDTRDLNNGSGNNGEDDVYGVGRTYGVNEAQWVGGRFDEVRVYDRVLSDEEIAALLIPGVGLEGDYNLDNQLNEPDLNLQAIAISEGNDPPEYDLNGDDLVNFADRKQWVEVLKNTWIGDADLDGEFNSSDMVGVFVQGKYETGENASWSDGDWNGDQKFTSGDMVAAFAGGGYERGQRPSVMAVPEPTSGLLALLALGSLLQSRRWTFPKP